MMQQWYKCTKCNFAITYGTNPCPNCKYPVIWHPEQPAYNKSQSSYQERSTGIGRNLRLNYILAAVLIILLICGGIVLTVRYSSQGTKAPVARTPPVTTSPATSTETLAATQSETPAVQPMPVLEVNWEEIKLPPLKYGEDGIGGFVVENKGNTIAVCRCIGLTADGKGVKYSLWRTEDGAKTWKEVGEITPSDAEGEKLGFRVSPEESISSGPATALANEDEVVRQQLNPFVIYGNTWPWMISKDQDNIVACMLYNPFESPPHNTKRYFVFRLFLSTDRGETWTQLNFPSRFASYDAYPETPELTLLSESKKTIDLAGFRIETVSSGDGSIKLFLISSDFVDGFCQATIKISN
ncbi:MAG: hypothetical protein WCO26_24385 [Deltaproteobacteria bacterium]